MVKLMLVSVVALVAGCGGNDEPPPSCQQAASHYYGVGCVFINTNTGQQITQLEFAGDCQEIAAEIDGRCDFQFEDWLFCLDSVAGRTNEGCDCSAEFQALLVCGT